MTTTRRDCAGWCSEHWIGELRVASVDDTGEGPRVRGSDSADVTDGLRLAIAPRWEMAVAEVLGAGSPVPGGHAAKRSSSSVAFSRACRRLAHSDARSPPVGPL